ncbi:SDR family NAD(P)-dependent oxidoreductase [Dysgonomonas sp. ZJ279]|uniref:SDR family NAD(P)-dependent oxidoreductase n=1 Tax=Dysgonomonas sp. ZJ279 TaxID=2709796 RepID=UPI0013EBA216|nr:SDR family NAD(P)-dependent oxidoreductase [Dysgonomonas sp. ZJ279]
MKKIALITGTTSGIGRVTALKLAKEGYNLILAGPRSDRLAELQKEIESKYKSKVLLLSFDIRVYTEVEDALLKNIPKEWSKIDVLVNNAGLGSFSPIHEWDTQDWNDMIDTNIKGLLYATRAITPGMVLRRSGHIINIGSTVERETFQNGNVHCATKFAVDGLSKGMRLDLQQYGIRVTQICPGRVEADFALVSYKGDTEQAKNIYEIYTSLKVEDIANAISYALSQPAHVKVQDIFVLHATQVL